MQLGGPRLVVGGDQLDLERLPRRHVEGEPGRSAPAGVVVLEGPVAPREPHAQTRIDFLRAGPHVEGAVESDDVLQRGFGRAHLELDELVQGVVRVPAPGGLLGSGSAGHDSSK